MSTASSSRAACAPAIKIEGGDPQPFFYTMSIQRMKEEIELTQEAIHQLNVKLAVLQIKLKVAEETPPRPVGTKFKWTKGDDYRVAIQTKTGFLEVKVVKDGQPQYHETTCTCTPCTEIRLSNGQIPPWRKGPPLKTTFFENEFHWRESFDEMGGKLVIFSAPLPKDIRALSLMPLEAKTDGLKLKELEKRFPGAIFTLIVAEPEPDQYDIKYEDGGIACEKGKLWSLFFSGFGDNPHMLISWRGYVFDIPNIPNFPVIRDSLA